MQIISSTADELFYLCCFLTHLSTWSFDDLCTIDNIHYNIYHDAALHLSLFTNQNKGYYTLLKTVTSYHTPAQLCFLFIHLILEGYPISPLWTDFRDNLIYDFIHQFHSTECGVDHALQSISDLISDSHWCFSNYGLSKPQFRTAKVITEAETYQHWLQKLKDTAFWMFVSMTKKQSHIYNIILQTILHQICHPSTPISPFFTESKPEWSKTFLIDALSVNIIAIQTVKGRVISRNSVGKKVVVKRVKHWNGS